MDGTCNIVETDGRGSDLERLTVENAGLRRRLQQAGLEGAKDDVHRKPTSNTAEEVQAEGLVAELLALNAKLRMADAFTQRLLNASEDCIKLVDFNGVILSINAGGLRVLNADCEFEVIGRSWLSVWVGDDACAARRALDDAREGGSGRFQGRFKGRDGRIRWWDVIATAVAGPSGSPESLLVVSRDITDQREAQAYRNVMHEELRHRLKNMLAMVQAIVAQTLRTAPTPADARAAVDRRVVALSRAHDLLSGEGGRGAALAEVVSEAMRPFDDGLGRISIEGPGVFLPTDSAVAFALMLNEMGTNATKYGALSTSDGQVGIAWSRDHERLRFAWRETGGPEVAPPTHRGFGSVLIDRNLAHQLDAEVHLDYPPSGVTLTLTAALPKLPPLAYPAA